MLQQTNGEHKQHTHRRCRHCGAPLVGKINSSDRRVAEAEYDAHQLPLCPRVCFWGFRNRGPVRGRFKKSYSDAPWLVEALWLKYPPPQRRAA